MGCISAMNSIDRVLEKHGDEIRKRELDKANSPLVKDVVLENDCYGITITYVLIDDVEIDGRQLDIDALAEVYPDCEVGY